MGWSIPPSASRLDFSSHRTCDGPTPASKPLDVPALTGRMNEGDEMAYRLFHQHYFDRLTRYLLVVTAGNEEATREALQRTLVRVVRHVRQFPNDDVFWSWLTVLARSALSDERRQQRRYFVFLDRFKRHATVEHEAAGGNDERAARLGETLERHLAFLPAEDRALIEKKYYERQPVSAIAGELQTTEKAVESRLGRIRRKLKEAVLAELRHESPR